MASSTRREGLRGAATLVAWLVSGAAALAQHGNGATRSEPGAAAQSSLTDAASGSAQDRTPSLGSGVGRRDADQEIARAAMARGTVVPLDRVLKKATEFVPGDVLDVKLRGRPETAWVYEIRMLSEDGRIRLVVVDAARNMVLEVRRP